jgi:acyl-[acyl-carrier-protein]-phospholipid O-acyltransferase / long-chain-fatty-acid--[acyl-carrier-protein] ligase
MKLLKFLLRRLLTHLYRVEVRGLEHYRNADGRVLVVANHTSFLDAVLLAAFLPGELSFAVNTVTASSWPFRPLMALANVFPMDPANPLSMKSLARHLDAGKRTAIFPEGRITVTGALMKIYDGAAMVADKTGATVIPVRIDGAQYTPFSRLGGRVRRRWFPRITLTVLAPRSVAPADDVRGRARRHEAGRLLADAMTDMVFTTTDYHRTLWQALEGARRAHGGRKAAAEDMNQPALSYDRLILGARLLGKRLVRGTETGERIGLLLPNGTAAVTAFFGLQAYGRVPAMLNHTLGAHGLASTCRTATVRRVVTSRRFVEAAGLEDAVAQLAGTVEILYLEDIATFSAAAKAAGWLRAHLPARNAGRPDDPAVVLFTSGSEGAPKGVVLSHANLLANCAQVTAKVDFNAQDVVLNAMPQFHSFGLTAATLLPLFTGMKTVFYPSPLHYRIVPELAYDVNATVLFGTNTFLAGYGRHAHPYDFYSVRYVIAGAEPVQEQTRRLWADKFGVRLFEGYGATETAPVLAVNTPLEYRAGTVGRLLPGIEHHLVKVPGIDTGGRLEVRGPNVMLGYLRADNPGVLVPPATDNGPGWYDTGDIVNFDEAGYLSIQGRAKRFAKVGGEMVSLAAVETLAAEVWPDAAHAAVSLPDPGKGETVVLLTESTGADRAELLVAAKARRIAEIQVPRRVLPVTHLPRLGTGKVDFQAARALAAEIVGEVAA